MRVARGRRWKAIHWTPWYTRGAATVNLIAVVMTLSFLVRLDPDSLGKRMLYINTNETVMGWSWGMNLAAVMAMTGVFAVLTQIMDPEYRAILQMALMIWVIGAAAWVMHDVIQITLMPDLSRLFLEVPTEQLASYIMDWETLLVWLIGVFSCSCFAVSGYIYTAVMFRTSQFSKGFARYSFSVWSFVLLSAILFRWEERLSLWLIACALLLLIPWTWLLAGEMARVKKEESVRLAGLKA